MPRLPRLTAREAEARLLAAGFELARAYVDQLRRSKNLAPAKASEIKSALNKIDRAKPDKAALDRADALATRLEAEAGTASGRDAMRLKALAATVKGRVAALR